MTTFTANSKKRQQHEENIKLYNNYFNWHPEMNSFKQGIEFLNIMLAEGARVQMLGNTYNNMKLLISSYDNDPMILFKTKHSILVLNVSLILGYKLAYEKLNSGAKRFNLKVDYAVDEQVVSYNIYAYTK